MYGKRFTEMKEQCAKQLLNVNKTAIAYINGEYIEMPTEEIAELQSMQMELPIAEPTIEERVEEIL